MSIVKPTESTFYQRVKHHAPQILALAGFVGCVIACVAAASAASQETYVLGDGSWKERITAHTDEGAWHIVAATSTALIAGVVLLPYLIKSIVKDCQEGAEEIPYYQRREYMTSKENLLDKSVKALAIVALLTLVTITVLCFAHYEQNQKLVTSASGYKYYNGPASSGVPGIFGAIATFITAFFMPMLFGVDRWWERGSSVNSSLLGLNTKSGEDVYKHFAYGYSGLSRYYPPEKVEALRGIFDPVREAQDRIAEIDRELKQIPGPKDTSSYRVANPKTAEKDDAQNVDNAKKKLKLETEKTGLEKTIATQYATWDREKAGIFTSDPTNALF